MPVNTASDGASDSGSAGDGDSGPITVDPGKGWLVALPVPEEVLARLGGPARLGERLQPILNTQPGQSGPLTPDASDPLASAYDELFRQLTAVRARRRDGGGTGDPANPVEVDPDEGRSVSAARDQVSDSGSAGDGDPGPITVDPGKGWMVALPVPEEVLGKLGGASQVGERLRPILAVPPGRVGPLSPGASDKLASAYSKVLQHLAAASRREGR
jgi:hypothetical protein